MSVILPVKITQRLFNIQRCINVFIQLLFTSRNLWKYDIIELNNCGFHELYTKIVWYSLQIFENVLIVFEITNEAFRLFI